MTSEEKNRKIAEVIDELWCCKGSCIGISFAQYPDLADPRYTLLLIEWAAKQGWWKKESYCGLSPQEAVMHVVKLVGGHNKNMTGPQAATRIRDLIFDAIQEQDNGK